MTPFASACFFFNDTATTEIYTLSLHDALPICRTRAWARSGGADGILSGSGPAPAISTLASLWLDRKSTRLNSSHMSISYAVFCLKKKKRHAQTSLQPHRLILVSTLPLTDETRS